MRVSICSAKFGLSRVTFVIHDFVIHAFRSKSESDVLIAFGLQVTCTQFLSGTIGVFESLDLLYKIRACLGHVCYS